MKWRQKRPSWVTRNGAFLCTGLLIVWAELALWALAGRTPNDVLTGLAVGMLWPAAREGMRTVLGSESGGGPSSSSPSSPPPSPPSSPSPAPPAGVAGEHRK